MFCLNTDVIYTVHKQLSGLSLSMKGNQLEKKISKKASVEGTIMRKKRKLEKASATRHFPLQSFKS